MMKSRASVFTTALVALWVAASACHSRRTPERSPGAAALAAHPLALASPEGSARADRVIADLQERLRREPPSPEAWVQLGHAWVRKARESSEPDLYRSAADCADAALE